MELNFAWFKVAINRVTLSGHFCVSLDQVREAAVRDSSPVILLCGISSIISFM